MINYTSTEFAEIITFKLCQHLSKPDIVILSVVSRLILFAFGFHQAAKTSKFNFLLATLIEPGGKASVACLNETWTAFPEKCAENLKVELVKIYES